VKTERPTSNYGSEPYIRVRLTATRDYDSYLKFNVSGTGGQVSSATLWLYAYDGGADGGTLHVASNNYLNSTTPWTESGLTWDNAPGMGTLLDSAGSVADDSWVAFDVTSAITGDGTYSFGLSNQDGTSVFYYSKEAANFQPRLEIQTGSGAGVSSFGERSLSQPMVEQSHFEVEDPDELDTSLTTPTPEPTQTATEVTPEPTEAPT